MSLDKAIEHGKEKRKQYTGGALYARSCRNHGNCEVCSGNRLYKFRERHPSIKEDFEPFNRKVFKKIKVRQ